jgi:hypothetical protein
MKKRILMMLAAAVILQTAAWSATCVVGTVADYQALGATGCTIGDKLFNNFTFTPTATGGATLLTASSVTLTPITGPDIGLQFNALWFAGTNQFQDTTIGFDVTVVGGGSFLIKEASTLTSPGGFTGTGAATVSEGLCIGSPCTPVLGTNTINTAGTTILSSNVIFTPSGTLHAVKDIGVTGGSNGTANLSQVTDTFSQTQVPEPTSILLLGSVMVVTGGFFRRRQAQKSSN